MTGEKRVHSSEYRLHSTWGGGHLPVHLHNSDIKPYKLKH